MPDRPTRKSRRQSRPGLVIGPTTGDADVQEEAGTPVLPRRERTVRAADARIEREIRRRLAAHGTLGKSAIEVTVRNGEVTLRGRVPDGPAKRIAEHIGDAVAGAKNVKNELVTARES